jgi:hypothetical protein
VQCTLHLLRLAETVIKFYVFRIMRGWVQGLGDTCILIRLLTEHSTNIVLPVPADRDMASNLISFGPLDHFHDADALLVYYTIVYIE